MGSFLMSWVVMGQGSQGEVGLYRKVNPASLLLLGVVTCLISKEWLMLKQHAHSKHGKTYQNPFYLAISSPFCVVKSLDFLHHFPM